MQTEEQQQEIIDKFVTAIRKILKEIDPDQEIKDEKIKGILILQFPEDHAENGEVIATCIGKICFNHTIQYLREMQEEIRRRVTCNAS